MTELVPGMPATSLSADKLRSSPDELRQRLAELAARGQDVWTGPLAGLVDALVAVARVDLCLARLVEGHSDGLRILHQAGQEPRPGVYGVWASRSVGTGLQARPLDADWQLRGELRFASGVDLIDRALVPGWLGDETHVLLDVPAQFGVPDRDSWRTSGMDAARTYTIHVDTELLDVTRVGPANFYLDRPGFVVGGLCVAAVWAGGAQHLLDVLTTSLRSLPSTPHQLRRVGVMEEAVWQAMTALRSTVSRLGGLSEDETAREIASTRTCVVQACEIVLDEIGRVVGPAGMSRNARLARTVEDLAIYIRQHHVDNELAGLGEHALTSHEVLAE